LWGSLSCQRPEEVSLREEVEMQRGERSVSRRGKACAKVLCVAGQNIVGTITGRRQYGWSGEEGAGWGRGTTKCVFEKGCSASDCCRLIGEAGRWFRGEMRQLGEGR
jgi:hypothetical protein